MKSTLTKIKLLHVNHEVLAATLLHMQPNEQKRVNFLIHKVLQLPDTATGADIEQKRQIMVDGLDEYDVILDAFEMLKKMTDLAEGKVKYDAELVAESRMLIGSIEHDDSK